MVDAGASTLGSRRGEDNRFAEERDSVARRRAIDEAYASRGEGEARADVARRLRGADGAEGDDDDDEGPEVVWDQARVWDEDDDPEHAGGR
jgi:GTP-binding protein